jgi:hypothetical protein
VDKALLVDAADQIVPSWGRQDHPEEERDIVLDGKDIT